MRKFCTLFLLILLASPAFSITRFVNANVSGGTGDGLSWTNAHDDLQDALTLAVSGDEIWVAAGTYTPTATTDRTISFIMKDGVGIYGGFDGTEALRTERDSDPATNGTVLSGEIDGGNAPAGNSYHVILNDNNGLTTSAILDGFNVTNGNADDAVSQVDRRGGGMYNRNSSPRVVNCVFENNAATIGGAMYNVGSSPEIEKCIFQNNSASSEGGAISNKTNSNPRIDNCVFLSNTSSGRGGAVDFDSSSNLLMTNCQFKDNGSIRLGGAFFAALSSLKFINCSFENNNSASGGGGFVNNSMAEFINCSFQKNISNAVEVFNLGATSSSAQLTNCVLWDNAGANALKASSGGGPGTATITVTYSLLDAAIPASAYTDGGNNSTTATNPFASATSTELSGTSPAIDAGDGALYTTAVGPANDLAGNPRVANSGIDQGAYEFQGVPICTTPTAYVVTGDGSYCVGSKGVSVGLDNSETGVNYQLKVNGTDVDSPVSGTGTTLDFGSQTAGTYTVEATTTAGGCIETMTGSVTVTENPLPTANAGADQSVILGFGGPNSNCTDLTATASGGSGSGYTYAWDNGAGSGSTVNVCPVTTTTYEVTVTDGNGCMATDEVTVTVQDVRCGPGLNKVSICYYGVTQCVSSKIAKRYKRLGATIGGCGSSSARVGVPESAEQPFELSVKAYPNPVIDAVTVEVLSPRAGAGTFEVLDLQGRARQTRRQDLQEGRNEVLFRLGSLPTGIYLIRGTNSLNQQGVIRVKKQ